MLALSIFTTHSGVVNDVITPDAERRLTTTSKGYGIKAFDLGGHGNVVPLVISDATGLNLTLMRCAMWMGFFVTIINKEHGATARQADVTIVFGRACAKRGSNFPHRTGTATLPQRAE